MLSSFFNGLSAGMRFLGAALILTFQSAIIAKALLSSTAIDLAFLGIFCSPLLSVIVIVSTLFLSSAFWVFVLLLHPMINIDIISKIPIFFFFHMFPFINEIY
ncbi:hypothetical protein [Helcococcus kunzii]|uniref:hypothetical protein n=1 Tax=Helcococcus kunzii TaxID=40091 RepID=UPI0021BC0B5C|nr:hypothetical protein [Helcococcus kunzii]